MSWGHSLVAQTEYSVRIQIPEMQIYADRLVRGDEELWGLGDWECVWDIELSGDSIYIRGKILFRELANDMSVFVGKVERRIRAEELAQCPFCTLDDFVQQGCISGKNAGAVGYRRYRGVGIVRSGFIQTDTFGPDLGKVGGTVRFRPMEVPLRCSVAGVNE